VRTGKEKSIGDGRSTRFPVRATDRRTEQCVGAISRGLRAPAAASWHVGILRYLCIDGGFECWDMRVMGTADDHMAERIPLVPAADDGSRTDGIVSVAKPWRFYHANQALWRLV
jgi:hypothetical protein